MAATRSSSDAAVAHHLQQVHARGAVEAGAQAAAGIEAQAAAGGAEGAAVSFDDADVALEAAHGEQLVDRVGGLVHGGQIVTCCADAGGSPRR